MDRAVGKGPSIVHQPAVVTLDETANSGCISKAVEKLGESRSDQAETLFRVVCLVVYSLQNSGQSKLVKLEQLRKVLRRHFAKLYNEVVGCAPLASWLQSVECNDVFRLIHIPGREGEGDTVQFKQTINSVEQLNKIGVPVDEAMLHTILCNVLLATEGSWSLESLVNLVKEKFGVFHKVVLVGPKRKLEHWLKGRDPFHVEEVKEGLRVFHANNINSWKKADEAEELRKKGIADKLIDFVKSCGGSCTVDAFLNAHEDVCFEHPAMGFEKATHGDVTRLVCKMAKNAEYEGLKLSGGKNEPKSIEFKAPNNSPISGDQADIMDDARSSAGMPGRRDGNLSKSETRNSEAKDDKQMPQPSIPSKWRKPSERDQIKDIILDNDDATHKLIMWVNVDTPPATLFEQLYDAVKEMSEDPRDISEVNSLLRNSGWLPRKLCTVLKPYGWNPLTNELPILGATQRKKLEADLYCLTYGFDDRLIHSCPGKPCLVPPDNHRRTVV